MKRLIAINIVLLAFLFLSSRASGLDVPVLQSDLTDGGNIRQLHWKGVNVKGLIIGPTSPNGDFLHNEDIIQKWEDVDSRWLLTIVGNKNVIIFRGNGHFGINYYFSDTIGAQIICVVDYLMPTESIAPLTSNIVVCFKRGVDGIYIPMTSTEFLQDQQ